MIKNDNVIELFRPPPLPVDVARYRTFSRVVTQKQAQFGVLKGAPAPGVSSKHVLWSENPNVEFLDVRHIKALFKFGRAHYFSVLLAGYAHRLNIDPLLSHYLGKPFGTLSRVHVCGKGLRGRGGDPQGEFIRVFLPR